MRTGIDLIEIERLERALDRRPRLAGRLFREGELEYARVRRRPGRHLAARFAAKEATIKVLGSGVAPRDIEISSPPGGGPPSLRLHGTARHRAGALGLELAVSLTHSRELAAASVLAASAPAGRPGRDG